MVGLKTVSYAKLKKGPKENLRIQNPRNLIGDSEEKEDEDD